MILMRQVISRFITVHAVCVCVCAAAKGRVRGTRMIRESPLVGDICAAGPVASPTESGELRGGDISVVPQPL